ncbi:hypothetical protein HA464_03220 [Rhizobium leguminosarum bv. trifolii]|uniref:hypothetical protein n=1 Tax=Rhizobium ruizarguesonis TaxID=2081791 RepID=UPI00102F5D12|nr:hypothetical protein [Rhizobium ruizarguesonis]QIO43089.1 hypothetical protein HA464_03220 [Rhizobium leguminosarum bv. trifolii]TAZ19511.1 hypothetical protein ELH77_12400 [Rhizobium ruizarguesonis]
MSARELGSLIDVLHSRGAFVRESAQTATISNLGAADARSLADVCVRLEWPFAISDSQSTGWLVDELDDAFSPFRIVITKPSFEDALAVLSLQGFKDLLPDAAELSSRWWVAGLNSPIRTWSLSFLPWERDEPPPMQIKTKNPRFLVREYGADRKVPDDVGMWLLRNPAADRGVADPYRNAWSKAATESLLRCLPNEIDAESNALRFRGPPRVALSAPSQEELEAFALEVAFDELQHALSWVFENERDTETRHALLAAEIARSGIGPGVATDVIRQDIKLALEGARIAFEMSLAAIGADTLKALGDLRKAVTEETSKVTEATRQTITAVSGALAVGLGLVAAKLTSTTSVLLIDALMLVAVSYVAMVIYSGWQFVRMQRKARGYWQPRLYRFLPDAEYQRLVKDPTAMAENAFFVAAWAGGGAVAILALVLFFVQGDVKKTQETQHSSLIPTCCEGSRADWRRASPPAFSSFESLGHNEVIVFAGMSNATGEAIARAGAVRDGRSTAVFEASVEADQASDGKH